MNILLCHGWGLDASYWKHLVPLFFPHRVHVIDQGYFRKPIPFPCSGTWIGVGHSLGFIKLLQSSLSFSALIGINSFLEFLGPASIRTKRHNELLAITKSFKEHPIHTLSSFREGCGMPHQGIDEECLNKDLLLNDLKSLAHDYSALLPARVPCLSIESSNDPIVPLACGLGANQGVSRIIIEANGHSLGLHHALAVKNEMTNWVRTTHAL